MPDNDLTDLGIDTTQGVAALASLNGALQKYAAGVNNVISVSAQYNKAGSANILTIKSQDDALNQLSTTLKATKDGYRVLKASATEAVDAQKQVLAVQRQINEGLAKNRIQQTNESAGSQAKSTLTTAFAGNKLGIASDAELTKFNRAIDSIANQVTKGKISLAELNAVFIKSANGATDLTIQEQRVVTLFNAAKNAASQFGDASVNASNRAARASQAQYGAQQKVIDELIRAREKAYGREHQDAQKQQAAGIAQNLTSQAFSSKLGSAQPKQILAFNSAMQKAVALVSSGKVNLQQFATVLQNVNTGKISSDLNPTLSKLQQLIYRANTALKTLGTDGENAGKRIGLSFQAVGKIFQSQLLYSGFSRITQGLQDSVTEASDYEKQIALIQTISQDSNVSFNQWASGIRKVSDELGNPIADTAQATYDLLSNQVTKGAESFAFLNTSLQFARTTGATATDSINLFSSAINSFGLNAGDADKLARTFFTTIDLGRVTASELANSFGRTATLASSLGVSLEETQAGISTLTRQGIKANEAYTLLNNVFVKLIKPTDELQGFLNKLGFASGQDAIAALGFQGVLKKLSDEFAGNTDKAFKFFDEIRGGRGILNLTGKGLQEFQSDFAKIVNSGDTYDIAKKLVSDNAGQKFTQELNKIKNFFINDFGKGVLENIVEITDKFGGLSNIVEKLTKTVGVIAGVLAATFIASKIAAAVGSLAITFEAAATGAGILSTTLLSFATASLPVLALTGGLIGIGVALTAALASTVLFRDGYLKAAADIKTNNDKLYTDLTARQNEYNGTILSSIQADLKSAEQFQLQYLASIRAKAFANAISIKDANKALVDGLTDGFAKLKSISGDSLKDLESNLKNTTNHIKDAREALTQSHEDANKSIFERRFSNAQSAGDRTGAANLVNKRVTDLRKLANEKLFNEDDVAGFTKYMREIDTLYERIGKTQQKYSSYQLIPKKDGTLQSKKLPGGTGPAFDQRNITALTKINETYEERALRTYIERQEQQQKTQTDTFKAQRDNLDRISEAENSVKSSFSAANEEATKLKTTIDGLNESLNQQKSNATNLIDQFRNYIRNGYSPESSNGTPDQLRKEAERRLNSVQSEFQNPSDTTGEGREAALGQFRKFIESNNSKDIFGKSDLDAVIQPGDSTKNRPQVSVQQGLIGLQNSSNSTAQLDTDFDKSYKQWSRIRTELDALPKAMQEFASAGQGAGVALSDSILPAVKKADALIQKLQEAKALINALDTGAPFPKTNAPAGQVTPKGVVEEDSRGGTIGYFSKGGSFLTDFFNGRYASGTDRIPAMLSPGEEVINAKESSQFRPLIKAINSGRLSQGSGVGSSYHTSVGDINITVAGRPTTEGTIREIGFGLRRAIRTGSLNFPQ